MPPLFPSEQILADQDSVHHQLEGEYLEWLFENSQEQKGKVEALQSGHQTKPRNEDGRHEK